MWRATGQNMRQTLNRFGGGGAWSQCTRSRHYSNVPFRRARFVIPTFFYTGKMLTDTDLPASFNFQVGLEYPFNASFAGIPPRIPVTFGGRHTASYVVGAGSTGYLLSDVVDFGSIVSPRTFFGLWTTIENAAGPLSSPNSIPGQVTLSNNYQTGWQRYTGVVAASTSLIANASALTAGSIAPAVGAQGGGGYGFSPGMMLIECAPRHPCVVGIGDSIMYGVGEGDAGSGTRGDTLGSALGNAGFPARWVFETLGYDFVNLGRPSDAFGKYSPINWKYRLQLLALACPTHILSQNGHNDISGGAGAAAIVEHARAAYAAMRAAVPGVRIVQTCCTPNSASTDGWATAVNQSAAAMSWSGPSSTRGAFNEYVRTQCAVPDHDGFADPNPAVEYGYIEGSPTTESSLWNVTGSPYGWTRDGTHPNSLGHERAAAGMLAGRNGAVVADPFGG